MWVAWLGVAEWQVTLMRTAESDSLHGKGYITYADYKSFTEEIMSEKQYDYLVVGGEHHNISYTHQKVSSLKLEVKRNLIAEFSDKNAPAKTLVPELIEYKVREWRHNNGKYYFIATNDENAEQQHDIDKMIDGAVMQPI